MRDLLKSIRLFAFMTVLLGLAYPAFVTAIGGVVYPSQANGSKIERDGKVVGSSLISQKFDDPRYFSSRPSSIDFNPLASGGSNLGVLSADLKKAIDERVTKLATANGPSQEPIPADLMFASGSGLDPEISPSAAYYQAARVARVRHIEIAKVSELIASNTKGRQLGFLGEERVNVLQLNLALDHNR